MSRSRTASRIQERFYDKKRSDAWRQTGAEFVAWIRLLTDWHEQWQQLALVRCNMRGHWQAGTDTCTDRKCREEEIKKEKIISTSGLVRWKPLYLKKMRRKLSEERKNLRSYVGER